MWYNIVGGDTMSDEKKPFDKVTYNNAFIARAYDRVNLTVPKGYKDELKRHADKQGESVNAFLLRASREQMDRDNDTTGNG